MNLRNNKGSSLMGIVPALVILTVAGVSVLLYRAMLPPYLEKANIQLIIDTEVSNFLEERQSTLIKEGKLEEGDFTDILDRKPVSLKLQYSVTKGYIGNFNVYNIDYVINGTTEQSKRIYSMGRTIVSEVNQNEASE